MKLKIKILILLAFVASCEISGAQSVVQFFLTQFTGATNDTTITVKSLNNPIIYNGVFYWQPPNGTNLNTTNGFAQITLIPGQYNVSFASIPQSWTITVTNSVAPLNAAGLTISTLIYSGINSLTGSGVTTDAHGNYSINSALPQFVVTNGGAFNGLNATNIPGYAGIRGGPFQIQNGVSLSVVATSSFVIPFGNTNWVAVTMPGGAASSSPYTLTNDPFIQMYCGYPTNYVAFGFENGLSSWVASDSHQGLIQSQEFRLKTVVYGNQLGMYTEDGNVWYRSDGSAWVDYNAGSPGLNTYWTFTWPNFGRHEIELHFGAGTVLGIYYPATNSLVLSSSPTTGIIVGDSITDGANLIGGENLWPAQLEDLLMPFGINVVPQGEGGTGYYATNSVSWAYSFLNRVTNSVINFNPSFIIWAGGFNDTTNTLYAAATNCYGSVKANLPNCKQIVIAGWPDSETQSPNADGVAQNQILSNAAAVYGLPIIYPCYTTNTSWVTGVLGSPWSGNYPLFISNDGVHPSVAGHQFYAQQVANFILTNLLTNATPILW
ncbi:MAG TPA: SGNH/GDSL hydrolase family protein [Candidatus Acidoferrum sp.]|nr:SGNH/GDSL hydrolase family protein [Candidatus Acidoferrum sp.]